MLNRRHFFAGGAAAATTALSAQRVISAGDRIGFIAGGFKEIGAGMAAAGPEAANTGARPLGNYRTLLDGKSLDEVVIAAPDHWPAAMTKSRLRRNNAARRVET